MYFTKQGSGQVDWIISLGLFLLFIAWFFVLIPHILIIDHAKPFNPFDRIMANCAKTHPYYPIFFNTTLTTPIVMQTTLSTSLTSNLSGRLTSIGDYVVIDPAQPQALIYATPTQADMHIWQTPTTNITADNLHIQIEDGYPRDLIYHDIQLHNIELRNKGIPYHPTNSTQTQDFFYYITSTQTSSNVDLFLFPNPPSFTIVLNNLSQATLTMDLPPAGRITNMEGYSHQIDDGCTDIVNKSSITYRDHTIHFIAPGALMHLCSNISVNLNISLPPRKKVKIIIIITNSTTYTHPSPTVGYPLYIKAINPTNITECLDNLHYKKIRLRSETINLGSNKTPKNKALYIHSEPVYVIKDDGFNALENLEVSIW